MTRHKQSSGQAYVITILFLAVLLAMAAAVLDIGSWYRADRSLQATVDAAALAGAQALPDGTASASTLASQYAVKNGGGTMNITFESQVFPNDTITVTRVAAGAGLLLEDARHQVRDRARDRFGARRLPDAGAVGRADRRGRAAPEAQVQPEPVLRPDPARLPAPQEQRLAGRLGQLRLHQPHRRLARHQRPRRPDRRTAGTSTWISAITTPSPETSSARRISATSWTRGSGTFCSSRSTARSPEPAPARSTRSSGWAGFRLSGLDLHGTNEILLGEFVSVTWDGIQAEKASDAPPDFGVTNVSLVE